jgi:hypothetical protein
MSEIAIADKIKHLDLQRGTPSAFYKSAPRQTHYNRNLVGAKGSAVVISVRHLHLLVAEDIMANVIPSETPKPLTIEKIGWNDEEALAKLFNEIEEEDRQLANAGYDEYLLHLEELESSAR